MKLRIEPAEGKVANGTKVYLDDVEVTNVRGLTLQAEVNNIWRLTLDMSVEVEGFQVDTTVLWNRSRTHRKASRWELVKAFLGMNHHWNVP